MGTQHSVLSTQHSHLIRVTQHATLERVLDQLRDGPSGAVTLLLDPLSVLFATPDHFRALDAVRIARRLSVIIAVADAHRTGLALAFGYRVRQPDNDPADDTAPVPDIQYGPPNRTGAILAVAQPGSGFEVRGSTFAVGTDRTPNREPRTPNPELRTRLWAVALAVSLLLSALGGSGIVVWNVHTAAVTVRPAEEQFSRAVPFAVSVLPTDDPNALQTRSFDTTIAREGDATATGTRTVPDGVASGVMTFRSRADSATTIKAGATLKGPRDVSYLLQSDVVVPGLDFVRGQLGEASGKVRATQPGPAGNLGAGFSTRYTDNITSISGEISGGTEKQVAVVTESDIAGLRARLERDLRMRALTEVNAALPAATTALNDYLTLPAPSVVAQPPAGTQADAVHVRVAIIARVPMYQNADFDALMNRRVTETLRDASLTGGGARAVLPDTVATSKPVFVDVQGPLVRYSATVTGTTRALIGDADLARIRAALAGRDARSAAQVLAGEPALGGYDIRYGPAWLPPFVRARMPRRASRIHLTVSTSQ